MKRLIFGLPVVALLAVAGTAVVQSDTRVVQISGSDETRKEIDGIFETLAKITGLKPKKAVDFTRIERSGLKAFLEERVKEVVKPLSIRLFSQRRSKAWRLLWGNPKSFSAIICIAKPIEASQALCILRMIESCLV
jgi:hypothetical protein